MYKLNNLAKKYFDGVKNEIVALDNISLDFPDFGMVFITGKSGCGKSTLLSILGGIENPTSGQIFFDEKQINNFNGEQIIKLRQEIGFVFQDFNLIHDFSVIENLAIVSNSTDDLDIYLEKVHLINKKNTPVRYLSGGERQRLAIARALVKKTKVLLLDEPTGSLDSANSTEIFNILRDLSTSRLVVVVTHDKESVHLFSDYIIELKDGRLEQYNKNYNNKSILLPLNDRLNNDICHLVHYVDNYWANENIRVQISYTDYDKIMEQVINKKKLLDFIVKANQEYRKGSMLVTCFFDNNYVEETTVDSYCLVNDQQHVFPKLKFTFCLKYAFNLLKNKIARTVISIILLTISIFLVFFQSNLLLSNQERLLENAIIQNNDFLLPVTNLQHNVLTNQDINIGIGRTFHNELSRNFADNIIPYFIASVQGSGQNIIQNFDVFVSVTDKEKLSLFPLEFKGNLPTNEGDILITDIMAAFMFNSQDVIGEYIKLSPNSLGIATNLMSFTIRGIIQTGFDLGTLDRIINNPAHYIDEIRSVWGNFFITTESFKTSILDIGIIDLFGSNFFLSGQTMPIYMMNSVRYSPFNQQNLIYGVEPIAKNEIVVSMEFLRRNAGIVNLDLENLGEILNRQFEFRDIASSPNFILYQQFFNIYDITYSVKIVGIVDDLDADNVDIFVTEEFFMSIVQQGPYYFVSGFSVFITNENISLSLEKIVSSGLRINFEYLNPIYQLDELRNSSFQTVLYALISLLLIGAFASLFFFCILNVNSKIKEINILKSLGFNNNEIAGIFLIQNFIITIISLIFAVVLGLVSIKFVNGILQNPDVLNINYNLLIIEWLSISIIFLLSFVISVLATIVPFIKIRKLDIAVTIKSNA